MCSLICTYIYADKDDGVSSLLPPLSYHQKYLLRQQRDVLTALNLTEEEIVTSHIATRLNGYCGGHGSLEALDTEMPKFNLPENIQKRVRGIVSRKSSS